MNMLQKTLAVQAAAIVLCLLSVVNGDAEIRTITATGEYRMGDNDNRTDAKRLALLDAKRLALEQAGTYIESITQVKNFDLSKEEIRAYTAGIVEVIEHATRTTMEGETTVVRVEVTTRIDTDVVAQQVDTLRQNEKTKSELLRLRKELDQLRQEAETRTRDLAVLKSKSEIEAATTQRQKTLTKMEAEQLRARAWGARDQAKTAPHPRDCSSIEGLDAAWRMDNKVLQLDPDKRENTYDMLRLRGGFEAALSLQVDESLADTVKEEIFRKRALSQLRAAVLRDAKNAEAHHNLGVLLAHEGLDYSLKMGGLYGSGEGLATGDAITELCMAAQLKPDEPRYHYNFAVLLYANGELTRAVAEFRMAIRLRPDDAKPHFFLGELLTELDGPYSGIPEYITAVRLNPDSKVARIALGRAFMEDEGWEGMVTEFRAALRLKPDVVHYDRREWDEADLRAQLGYALRRNGNFEEAVKVLRKAVKLKVDAPYIHVQLGNALSKKGDLDGAIAEYLETIRLTWVLPRYHGRLS